MKRPSTLPAAVTAIVPRTFLAALPPGRRLELSAGAVFNERRHEPGVALVLDGLVGVYLESPRLRQVTMSYARAGEALGIPHLLGARFPARAQAITDAALWAIGARHLRLAAAEHAPLALALAAECAARVEEAVGELELLTFGSVRERVARHLLDLGAVDAGSGELVAAVTQRELADATGSVREVVARVLRDLADAGLIARRRAGVRILDATGLDAVTQRARDRSDGTRRK